MSSSEINGMRKEIRVLVVTNVLVMFINVSCFIMFIFVWIMTQRGDVDPTTKERVQLRGYYYKSEYAAVMGVSETTVDRWREEGKIPDMKDADGRVIIPFDAKVDAD